MFPPRVFVWLWKVVRYALLTKKTLRYRGIQINTLCKICQNNQETLHQLLFCCPIIMQIWTILIPEARSYRHIGSWKHISRSGLSKTHCLMNLYVRFYSASKFGISATIFQQRGFSFQGLVSSWLSISVRYKNQICRYIMCNPFII